MTTMMQDSGIYKIEGGQQSVTIPHGLGVVPNIVEVSGVPDGSQIFTLENTAILVILPPNYEGGEVAWMVGYERPPEPERPYDEPMD
jgi:hypothetical protein